jgi:O-antigen/teichoic acid export membrane protein
VTDVVDPPAAPADAGSPPGAEPVPPASGGLRGRAAWTLADQALSSLTNFGLAILVARSVSAEAFGAFSIALLTFSFVIGINRATVSDPLMIRFSAAPPEALSHAVRQAAGAALVLGLVGGGLCALIGLLFTGDTRTALVALALALPGLLVQDTWRYGFFAAGRPRAATINDAVWTVVQFGAIGLLMLTGTGSVLLFTLAWGGAALAAGFVGCAQLRTLPDPSQAKRYYDESKHLSIRMGIDYVLNMGAVNLATYMVGAIVGLAGIGGLRAAQTLLGPLQLLFSGLSSFVLPVFSKQVASGGAVRRLAVLTAAVASGVAATWVLILVVLPRSLGESLLGDSWDGARHVMLACGVVSIAVAAAMGASLGLKALSRPDYLLRVTLVQAPLIVGLGAYGAVTDGATGAAIGFAIAQVVGAALSWIVFVAAERPAALRAAGRHRTSAELRPGPRHMARPPSSRVRVAYPEQGRHGVNSTPAAAAAATASRGTGGGSRTRAARFEPHGQA